MKIVYIISNFIYSAFDLLVLIVLYVERFGPGLLPEFLLTVLGKVADPFFSERNMIGHLIICIVCILFTVLTVILLIKNLIQKQNVTSFVLSAISIISMIGFGILTRHWDRSISEVPTLCGLAKCFFIFNMVIVAVQFIATVINVVKSYREEI